jgi:outer membrane protein assembly factor BamB
MMFSTRRSLASAAVVAAVFTAIALVPRGARSAADDGDWPQWRGPGGLGLSSDTSFVTEWSPTSNIKWKTEIPGRGHSSPVVWGDRIYLTTSIKGEQVPGRKAPVHLGFDRLPGYLHPDAMDVDYKHTLQVLAIDAKSGRILWTKTAYDGLMADDRHRQNTYASPTVATDGKLVYAFFESAGLYAYDVDGKLVWQASLGNIIKAGLGPGTSPVIYRDLLILQCDQEMGDGSAIVALDRQTGKQVWRADRTTRRSWATPLIVRAGDHDELITSGAEMVIGYDPSTGKELRRAPGTDSHPIPSPVTAHGMVFMTAGSQAKRAIAIRLGGSGNLANTPAIAWRYNKGTAYVTSPILVGQYLYLVSDAGLMTCLDVDTGELKYEGGRVPVATTFKASPVAFGDKILLTSEEGDTFVIKAGTTHEVLRTNSIGEVVWASPALSRGTIYIRGDKHLFAIGKDTK